MAIEYRLFERSDGALLADFLAEGRWPFHAGGTPDRDAVHRRIDDGYYGAGGGESGGEGAVRTLWVLENGQREGLVRLFDLDDDTAVFDLRIRPTARGRGLGTRVVRWLTEYLFTQLPHVVRVEATTRQDHVVMRRTLRRCGYVQEAHYRGGWRSPADDVHDAVGYAILRSDWSSGTLTPVPWDADRSAPTTIRIRAGEIAGCGSWLYVWMTATDRRVIYVGGTGLPPEVRAWLHLKDPHPDIGRIAARYPAVATTDIDVLARRLAEKTSRPKAKALLIRRLSKAGLLAVDYVGDHPVTDDLQPPDPALEALLDDFVAHVAAHQLR